jgi:hypothetical protein
MQQNHSIEGEVVVYWTADDFDLSEAEIAQLERDFPIGAYDWKEAQRLSGRHDIRHHRGGPLRNIRTRTRAREHRPIARRRSAASSTTSGSDPGDPDEPAPATLRVHRLVVA